MSDVKRIYVEKRAAYATAANEIKHNLIEQLGLEIKTLRVINRYDVQGISDDILNIITYSLNIITVNNS